MRRVLPFGLLLTGCATWHALFSPDRPSFVPPEAVHVSGAHSRAIAVAFGDWMNHLAHEQSESLKADLDAGENAGPGLVMPDEMRKPLLECLGRPEAYQTWVHQGDAGISYVVDILPFYEYCFGKNDRWLHAGGGAIYEIDARTGQILKKDIQE